MKLKFKFKFLIILHFQMDLKLLMDLLLFYSKKTVLVQSLHNTEVFRLLIKKWEMQNYFVHRH